MQPGLRLLSIGLSCLLATSFPVWAQAPREGTAGDQKAHGRAALQAREAYRERLNENVLFLMGGQLGAAYIQIAHDISVVVNDGNNLRVLPVVGGAGVQNVHDVVLLRGVDLALTNMQTLNALKSEGTLGPNLDRQISYIAPLFPEEMQVVARGNIQSLEDLRGKRVNFNNQGSATAQFGPLVFSALGIEVQPVFVSQLDAIQRLRNGEIEATVCICPKPVPAFSSVRQDWGLKLLEVTHAPALRGDYLPATITDEDYPALVPKREKIDTIAGGTVLITVNWPKSSVRYGRTAKFVDAFFSKFAELQKPPRHPLWKSVNYAASIPGWQRFPAAQEWLDRSQASQAAATEASFAEFMKSRATRGQGGEVSDPEERERLFRSFLEWSRKLQN